MPANTRRKKGHVTRRGFFCFLGDPHFPDAKGGDGHAHSSTVWTLRAQHACSQGTVNTGESREYFFNAARADRAGLVDCHALARLLIDDGLAFDLLTSSVVVLKADSYVFF
jgi:hypothetical protein